MTTSGLVDQPWTVHGLDAFSFPGWLLVRPGMSQDEKHEWLSTAESVVGGLVGTKRWDGGATTMDDLRLVLGQAFDEVEAVDAAATFQVWPLLGPATVMCRVMMLTSDSVPTWGPDDPGARHLVSSKRLGVGLQFTSRTQLESSDGAVDVEAMDLIFNDGSAAIVLTTEATFAPLLVSAMPGLQALMDTMWVERPDGTVFSGVAPEGVVPEETWKVEPS